ncbi:MAG: hypothetical protein L0215_16445 [Gemmataceae bacterium]|nr:hypothetical protein [Gemmataceae bacterium]
MAQPRSLASVTAIGVINIVVASLLLLLQFCGLVIMLVGEDFINDPNAKAMERFLEQNIPAHHVTQVFNTVFYLLLSVLLLVFAIGLLRRSNGCRVGTILLSWIYIFAAVAQLIYYFVLVAPQMSRFFQMAGIPGIQDARFLVTITTIIYVVIVLVTSVYALIVALHLSRAYVKEYFWADASDFDESRDERRPADDDWYERRQRSLEEEEGY